MDEQKLDKILSEIDTPAVDDNAKKRALNLAMAEFDAQQKEKEKKFQGSSIFSRLIGNHNDKNRRNSMEEKSRKNFVYGGMATAMAVIIIAGIGLDQAPQFSQNATLESAQLSQAAQIQGGGKAADENKLDHVWGSISSSKADKKGNRGRVSGDAVTGTYREALDTRNQQDFESAVEEQDSFAATAPVKTTIAPMRADQAPASSKPKQKLDQLAGRPYQKNLERELLKERQVKSSVGKASRLKNELNANSPMPMVAEKRIMTGILHDADESIALTPDDIIKHQYKDVGRDKFSDFVENPFKAVNAEPVSTFSVDVDTASYSFVRRQLNNGVLPQKDAVRIEELINYFDYDYAVPDDKSQPFKPTVALTDSPWNAGKKLMHIGIKGYEITDDQPDSNIVFLLDVSGSMNSPDKLPLVKNSLKMLLSSLKPDDTVSIAVYAGAAGTVLEPTKASDKAKIFAAFDRLSAGGSTAGAAGINLAYQLAEQNFDENAVNRVILATDGDFNVGISNREELKDFVERKREKGVFLSVLGFGQGNYNDDLMQALAQNGNGVAAYIDNLNEARKVLVEEATSSLFPIAKDVKIQIEFNPSLVSEYRLVGYETRALNREDFNNDAVDAGDIGAGHTVTAIYEITPVGATQTVDPLRYGQAESTAEKKYNLDNISNKSEFNQEVAFLKMRYKLPKEDVSKLITQPITYADDEAADTQFATAVASFAQILKGGKYTGKMNYDDVINMANASKGEDLFGYRSEFIQMVRLAQSASTIQPQ